MYSFSPKEIRAAIGRYADPTDRPGNPEQKPISTQQRDEMAIPSYLHWNPLVRWIISERLRVLRRIVLEEKVTGTLLDFGCGIGLLGVMLSPSCGKIYAVDLFIDPAKRVMEYFRVENMIPLDAESFRWDDFRTTFDAVVAADVLEHVDDPAGGFDAIEMSLRQNGRLLLSGPTENWFYGLCRKIAGFKGDYHHRTIYDLEKILSEKGWSRTRLRSIPWFLPIKMFRVSVWKKR